MPAASEPQDRHGHSPNWVMAGKAKQGGSELGNYPSVSGGGTSIHLPPWCRILPPTRWGAFAACGRVASYPLLKMMKNCNQQRNQKWQPEHEDMLAKKWGGGYEIPKVSPRTLGGEAFKLSPPKNLNCNRLNCYLLIRKDCSGEYCCHIFYLHSVWKSVLFVSPCLLVYLVGYY